MRAVTSNSAMAYSQTFMDRVRSRLANRPFPETGGTLNGQGDAAFRTRVNALLKENGIDGNVAFGRVEGNISLGIGPGGTHTVLNNRPDKEKIEKLLNNDEQLKQIKNDPAYAFDWNGGAQAASAAGSDGQDSAYFSEEARLLYELRAKSGEPAYASPQEETAEIMAWMDKRDPAKRIKEYIASGGELKRMTNTLTFQEESMSANPNFDFSNAGILQSGDMKEFLHARGWMETEVKSVLQNAGIDTSKLSGVKMAVHGGKLEVAKGQESVLSEEDRLKIQAALNAPANKELREVIGRVLGDEEAISGTLRRATGLSLTDWAEVMEQSGGDLANDDNEGMRKLLESDPDLAAGIGQLVGGKGIVGNASLPRSAETEADEAVSALGRVVSNYIKESGKAGELSPQEIASLKKNLVIEGDTFGNLHVSGTKNEKVIGAIREYFDHYTSGIFGDFLRRGAYLNQALGLGDADDGVNFSMTFADGAADAKYGYGDGKRLSARKAYP